jgi:hypothetical protein
MGKSEEKDDKTSGRWTKVEHQKFLLGISIS